MAQLVRLTSSADPTGLTLSTGVVGAVLGAVLLAIGIAHYRGYRWWVAHPRNVRQYTFVTQYTVLAMAWLGAASCSAWPPRRCPRCSARSPRPWGRSAGSSGRRAVLAPEVLRPRWLLALQADPTTDPRPRPTGQRREVDDER